MGSTRQQTPLQSSTREERLKNAIYARDFRFLRWWRRTIVQERKGNIHERKTEAVHLRSSANRYSPESLFADSSSSATFVLLRLLKHSLSDLQREFRLAQAVMLLIADWNICDNDDEERSREENDTACSHANEKVDGIECFRRLLSIISSEYVASCGGYCHERYLRANGAFSNEDAPTHYCSDVSREKPFYLHRIIIF
jgi:hypothetical protein